jgi:hypothetical protein
MKTSKHINQTELEYALKHGRAHMRLFQATRAHGPRQNSQGSYAARTGRDRGGEKTIAELSTEFLSESKKS